MFTTDQYEVHLQPIQEKFVRLSLLQNYFQTEGGKEVRKFRKIGELQGNALGGSININNNSPVRRTCSIEMVITDSTFLIGENTKIWLDKWFKVEIGIRSLKTGQIVWFDKGIFVINNPSVNYDHSSRNLSLEGLDIMATLDGTLEGSLGISTIIPNTFTISEAIRFCVNGLGKVPNSQIYVESNPNPIPFDIEKTESETVYSLLEEIKNLYMDWEMFFDRSGRFVYQKIKNRNVANPVPSFSNDVVVFKFLEDNDLAISYNLTYQFSNVKNKIVVWGRMLDSGAQIHYELENTDPNSPFSTTKNLGTRLLTVVDDNIETLEQAEQKARYEFYKHNNMLENVALNTLPLYFLDVNQMIEFDKTDIGLKGKYLIDSISVPIGQDGTMSINTHRIYEV